MLGRRFLVLVAVLMGLTALAASVAPQDPRVRDDEQRREQASPTPAPTVPPTPAEAGTLSETISADEDEQRVIVTEGEILELRVTGSELDTVSIEGLGKIEPVEADSPAVFNILAELPDEYPIVLLQSERRIGTLVVRAAT